MPEWLSWISIDLHGIGYGQLWRPHRFVADPALHEAVKSKGMENILTAYDHIDHILSDGREWAVPSQYTVVDAYLVVFWLWGRRIGLEMDTSWPNWAQLMNKVLERLAVKQALELEGRRDDVHHGPSGVRCRCQMLEQTARGRGQLRFAANTNGQFARRPAVLKPSHCNTCGSPQAPRCRFRYDADADALAGHSADTFETAKRYAQLQLRPKLASLHL